MAADESVNIETTSTWLVYENRWMRVREDTIRRRDGSNGIYGVVEKPYFVVIIPVEDDGRVLPRRAIALSGEGPILGISQRFLGTDRGGRPVGDGARRIAG